MKRIIPYGLYTMAALYVALMMLVIPVAATTGCGGTDKKTETLHALLVSTDAARDGFVQWDADARKSIVDKATSRDEALKNLTAQDTKIAPVQALLVSTYRAIALASEKADDVTVSQAVKTAADLADSIAKIKKGP